MCSFLWAFWLFPGLPSQTLLQWAPLDARAAEDQNCCVVWVFCFALFAGFSLLPTLTSSWRIVSLLEDSAQPSPFLSHFPDFPHNAKQTGSLCRWLLQRRGHCIAINFVHVCLLNQMVSNSVPSTSSVWAVSGTWKLLNLYLLGGKNWIDKQTD